MPSPSSAPEPEGPPEGLPAGSRYHPGTLPHPAALAGPPVDWAGVRRLLVVRPDNLGDVLLLGPALRALRAEAPAARITLLGSPAGAAVAPLLPEIDEVVVVSPVWQDAGAPGPPDPAAQLALVDAVRSGRFDAAVLFTSFSQSPHPAAYVCLLAGVPVRVALSREFGGALLTHWVPSPEVTQHQVDRALHLLERVGVGVPADRALHVRLPPGAVDRARRLAGLEVDERYVALLPGASCPSRRWDPAGFAAVARSLADGTAGTGRTVLVVGSAGEVALVDEVVSRAAAPGVRAVAGLLDVPGLAGLLAGADAAVVNNSGGMHLADAVRTPVVALFAGTELVAEYAPRSGPARVLDRPTGCTPCRAFACPYAHECLDVPPAEVVAAVRELAPR